MSIRKLVLLPAILLITTVQGFSQSPPWVLLARAQQAYEDRNLTTALDTLLDAVEANPEYPEAEYWLGKVYEAQGQAVLAEEQYRRALDLSLYLRVPEDRILIEYSLAELIGAVDGTRKMESEAILRSIANEEGASTPNTIAMDHQYLEIVTGSGLDDLIYLYRDELEYSLKARRILGERAWNEGRYRTALLESARVVLSFFSTAAEAYRRYDPQWRFDIDEIADAAQPDRDVRYPGAVDGAAALLQNLAGNQPEIYDWLNEEGFWSQLYLLASSLYAEGYNQRAAEIWSILVTEDAVDGSFSPVAGSGSWGRLAARQLDEPFISTGSLSP